MRGRIHRASAVVPLLIALLTTACSAARTASPYPSTRNRSILTCGGGTRRVRVEVDEHLRASECSGGPVLR